MVPRTVGNYQFQVVVIDPGEVRGQDRGWAERYRKGFGVKYARLDNIVDQVED
jgi:hypothetical protein